MPMWWWKMVKKTFGSLRVRFVGQIQISLSWGRVDELELLAQRSPAKVARAARPNRPARRF